MEATYDQQIKTVYDQQTKIAALEATGFECLKHMIDQFGTVTSICNKEELEFFSQGSKVAEWDGLSILASGFGLLTVVVDNRVYQLENIQATSEAEFKAEIEKIIRNLDQNLAYFRQSIMNIIYDQQIKIICNQRNKIAALETAGFKYLKHMKSGTVTGVCGEERLKFFSGGLISEGLKVAEWEGLSIFVLELNLFTVVIEGKVYQLENPQVEDVQAISEAEFKAELENIIRNLDQSLDQLSQSFSQS